MPNWRRPMSNSTAYESLKHIALIDMGIVTYFISMCVVYAMVGADGVIYASYGMLILIIIICILAAVDSYLT